MSNTHDSENKRTLLSTERTTGLTNPSLVAIDTLISTELNLERKYGQIKVHSLPNLPWAEAMTWADTLHSENVRFISHESCRLVHTRPSNTKHNFFRRSVASDYRLVWPHVILISLAKNATNVLLENANGHIRCQLGGPLAQPDSHINSVNRNNFSKQMGLWTFPGHGCYKYSKNTQGHLDAAKWPKDL